MNNRIRYLDDAKGFVIILMLLAHTMSGDGFIRSFISSFHMQFFFIVCGIIIANKYRNIHLDGAVVFKNTKRRFFQIGIPYLLFSLLLALFYTFLEVFKGQTVNIAEYLKRIILLKGMDSMWFLPVYFFAELLILCILCLRKGRKIALALSCIIVIVLSILAASLPQVHFIRISIKILIGVVFICFGYEVEARKILYKIPLSLAFMMLVCAVLFSHINGFAAMGSLELGNGILFFVNACLTSLFLLVVCLRVEESGAKIRFVNWFGRSTIVILCTNNLLIESIRLLDYKVTGNVLLHSGLTGCIIFTAILVFLEVPLIIISEGPFAFVFGRQVKKV